MDACRSVARKAYRHDDRRSFAGIALITIFFQFVDWLSCRLATPSSVPSHLDGGDLVIDFSSALTQLQIMPVRLPACGWIRWRLSDERLSVLVSVFNEKEENTNKSAH